MFNHMLASVGVSKPINYSTRQVPHRPLREHSRYLRYLIWIIAGLSRAFYAVFNFVLNLISQLIFILNIYQALGDSSKEVQRQVQKALEAALLETDRADVAQLIPGRNKNSLIPVNKTTWIFGLMFIPMHQSNSGVFIFYSKKVVANQLEIVQTDDSSWLIRYLALLWLRKLLPLSSCAAVKSAPICLQAWFRTI